MKTKPHKAMWTAAAVVAAVGLAGVAAYALDLPPFEGRGEISAERVCSSLGDPEKSVPALLDVLPSKPSYRFDDNLAGQGSRFFTSNCFVWNDGKVLLSARTRMLVADPPDAWAAEAIGEAQAGRAKRFDAGTSGVVDVSDGRAAVLVPCSAPGTYAGGSYSLSVVVDLRHHEESGKPAVEQRLVELAVAAARSAHSAATCDLPSKVPVAVPSVLAGPAVPAVSTDSKAVIG
ncbi:hypothetical protein ABZ990_28160 [Streptomyces sp. NPDC046203]|uniref:hypothetical protein n=1 Tax=Streptomyces sp. NPDC046203 TaxID=3154602 RepID=UPI0033DDE7EB